MATQESLVPFLVIMIAQMNEEAQAQLEVLARIMAWPNLEEVRRDIRAELETLDDHIPLTQDVIGLEHRAIVLARQLKVLDELERRAKARRKKYSSKRRPPKKE